MIDTIATFRDAVEKLQITVLDLPTAYWHELTSALSAHPFTMPESLRLVVIGGEQARADQLAIWHQHNTASQKLFNTYGPTEATVVTAREDLTASSTKETKGGALPVTVGHPLKNRTIYILDAHLQPTPIGVPGELYLGGHGLARGYHNLEKLTATTFSPDPFSDVPGARMYRSGDRGRYLADGRIELIGRVDRQVKIRGFRVELEEIESCLHQYAGVEEGVVVAQPNERGHVALVAYVVSAEEMPLALSALRGFLGETLPRFMVPGIIIPLAEFPRLPSGKIDRRALPAPVTSPRGECLSRIDPRTLVEENLVQIWAELFNLPTVDVRDNFFELGGHSLLATRLLSRVRDMFELDLPLRLFFDHPTLEEQALAIEEHLLEEFEDLEENANAAKDNLTTLADGEALSEEEVQVPLERKTTEMDAPESETND
jgi:hypothetical protein